MAFRVPKKAKKKKARSPKKAKSSRMKVVNKKQANKGKRSTRLISSSTPNRRVHRRITTRNLWVTEKSGDFQFVLEAGNISEGGIFLKNRIKTASIPSTIMIGMGNLGRIEVIAEPRYDTKFDGINFGSGYQFLNLSRSEAKTLRNFLRNLD